MDRLAECLKPVSAGHDREIAGTVSEPMDFKRRRRLSVLSDPPRDTDFSSSGP